MLNCYHSGVGERLVEVEFIHEMLNKYGKQNEIVLDVGGIPTQEGGNNKYIGLLNGKEMEYHVCDFRGGDYTGNFVTLPIGEKFNYIVFLSSLEHFSQCTEGVMIYREDEDIRGMEKAISLLDKGGKIFLTVPFGKEYWQPYHQNYGMNRINKFRDLGLKIVEQYIYRLCFDYKWMLANVDDMNHIYYTNKCFGLGCFCFEKV